MRDLAVVSVALLLLTASVYGQPARRIEPRPPIQGAVAVPTPTPDLRVTRLLFNQVDCNDSLCLKVEMDMHNSGEATKGPVDVRISHRVGSAPWTPLEVFHFAPQAHNHDTGAAKRFAFRESGFHCFRAEIDPENKVQPASATKNRDSGCREYVAGIPDPSPIALTIKEYSNAFGGTYRIQNLGDGKLSGPIKVVIDCGANGKPLQKVVDANVSFTISPGESAERHWNHDWNPKDVQTLQCRLTITPSFRERTSTNNTITSDLWRRR